MRLAAQPAQCRRPALVGVQSHRQSDRKVSESAVARGGRVEVAQRPLTSRRLRPRRCRRVPRLLQRETVGAQLLRYRPGTHPVAKAQARDAHRVPRVPVCPHGETRPRRRRKKHQSRASHRLGLQISLLEKRQVFVHIALGVMAEAEMPGIAQNLPMTALHPPAADLRRWMVSCADLAQADLRVADHRRFALETHRQKRLPCAFRRGLSPMGPVCNLESLASPGSESQARRRSAVGAGKAT